MTVITIRNVPDDLASELKVHAQARGQSLQSFLLRELTAIAERSAIEARWAAVLESTPRVEIPRRETLDAIAEVRDGSPAGD
ncbi:MAG: hypothetical protein KGP12_01710 [Actinomycetales bacterium]|nr:hypothetical protein [Actinomycetales bacterium]